MSFQKMKRDDLYVLATENFAVDLVETATKEQIIAALAENGVSWQMAKTFDQNAAAIEEDEVVTIPAVAELADVELVQTETPRGKSLEIQEETPVVVVSVPVVQAPPANVLLKMDRENPTYMIRGYKFTRANPFALVASTDADYILEHEEGFKVASPREVKEYYG